MRKVAKLTTVIDKEWDLDKIEEVFKAKVFFKNYTNSKGSAFECENKVPEEFRGDSDR